MKETKFKYEMHLHSADCSACGISMPEEYLEIAVQKGYSGMVFTNHFYGGNTSIDRHIPWQEFMSYYAESYYRTKQLAKAYDLDVLFGVEEGYGDGKEVLIYGISPELFVNTPEFRKMTIVQISEFVRSNGGFIAHAHPFRVRDYIRNAHIEPDHTLFDAVEVYNRLNNSQENLNAEKYAKKYNMRMISGGDVHSINGFGKTSLAFTERATDEKKLCKMLFEGTYRILVEDGLDNMGGSIDFGKQ